MRHVLKTKSDLFRTKCRRLLERLRLFVCLFVYLEHHNCEWVGVCRGSYGRPECEHDVFSESVGEEGLLDEDHLGSLRDEHQAPRTLVITERDRLQTLARRQAIHPTGYTPSWLYTRLARHPTGYTHGWLNTRQVVHPAG